MNPHDPVHHPAHYTAGAIECIDAIEAALTAEEFAGYCKGNALKYVWRAGRKGDAAEDADKARWYLARLSEAERTGFAASAETVFRAHGMENRV